MSEMARSELEPMVHMPPDNAFGFCEGVVAADVHLERVARISSRLGIPAVYGYHDIVHNKEVSQKHEDNGVIFIHDINDVPPGSVVVGSAHGSSPVVPSVIEEDGGIFFDAACPLVIHTHRSIQQARSRKDKVIYLLSGNPDKIVKVHDEVLGSIGHMDFNIDERGKLIYSPVPRAYMELTDDPEDVEDILTEEMRYRIVGQTTLLATETLLFREKVAQAIMTRQPQAKVARVERRDVCFAVEDRQEGVRAVLRSKPNTLIVVTDPTSKNGNGYANLAEAIKTDQGLDTDVIRVSGTTDLPSDLRHPIAVTASASTPDDIVRDVVVSVGGTDDQVPFARPSFKLRNSALAEIEQRILQWQESKK